MSLGAEQASRTCLENTDGLQLEVVGEISGSSRPRSRKRAWEQGREVIVLEIKPEPRSRAEEELETGLQRAQCPERGRDGAREPIELIEHGSRAVGGKLTDW